MVLWDSQPIVIGEHMSSDYEISAIYTALFQPGINGRHDLNSRFNK
jgi:hypothetical protein